MRAGTKRVLSEMTGYDPAEDALEAKCKLGIMTDEHGRIKSRRIRPSQEGTSPKQKEDPEKEPS